MIFQDYGIIAGITVLTILFVISLLVFSYIVQPKKPSKIKSSTYECGMVPIGDARIQFDLKYYVYAILFVIFEVEAVFLFPWAVAYNKVKSTMFAIEAIIFVVILVVGLLYVWKKGVLKWD